jgi:hypothetical protein
MVAAVATHVAASADVCDLASGKAAPVRWRDSLLNRRIGPRARRIVRLFECFSWDHAGAGSKFLVWILCDLRKWL